MQRYFKHVLKEGQPYISYARFTHDGQFKTGAKKEWIKIKGEQYATTEKPGFIWKGTTAMFTGEITLMETKRYMDKTKFETGVIKFADYKEMNNVIVPSNFEVLWRLEKGDFSYAKFKTTETAYNITGKF